MRPIVEIVDYEHGIFAPVVAQGEHVRQAGLQHGALAPPNLGTLFAEPDHPRRPVKEGIGITSLCGHIDVLITPDAFTDHRMYKRLGGGKPGVWLIGPLHGRTYGVSLVEIEVVAHPDLVAIPDDRRAGKREQDAIGKLLMASVAQHRSESSADASAVKLHVLLRPESLEHERTPFLA